MRVAVEVAAVQCSIVFQQPALQSSYLAFAEAGHVGGAAGETFVIAFTLGRQQDINPEFACDRRSDKPVGCGDDHQGIACGTVLFDQGQGFGQYNGRNLLGHKRFVPGIQLGRLMLAK